MESNIKQPKYMVMNPVYKWFDKVPMRFYPEPFIDIFTNEIRWASTLQPIKIHSKIENINNINDYNVSIKK